MISRPGTLRSTERSSVHGSRLDLWRCFFSKLAILGSIPTYQVGSMSITSRRMKITHISHAPGGTSVPGSTSLVIQITKPRGAMEVNWTAWWFQTWLINGLRVIFSIYYGILWKPSNIMDYSYNQKPSVLWTSYIFYFIYGMSSQTHCRSPSFFIFFKMVKTTPPTSGVDESLRFCWFDLQKKDTPRSIQETFSPWLWHMTRDMLRCSSTIFVVFFPK